MKLIHDEDEKNPALGRARSPSSSGLCATRTPARECVTDDALLTEFKFLGEAKRKLTGVFKVVGDSEHIADLLGREAGEDGIEADSQVRLNEHFVSPVRGEIAMRTASQAPRRRAR